MLQNGADRYRLWHANFGSGGANFEGYFSRFTPFATAGVFGVQSLNSFGYGTIGTAYYPTDNLQLALSGFDYGGSSGVQGGIEYLLPETVQGVATTVSVDGFAGNHGMSGATARLKLLFGPKTANNKTLIERRRQDDPITGDDLRHSYAVGEAFFDFQRQNTVQKQKACFSTGGVCSADSQCCSGICSAGDCI